MPKVVLALTLFLAVMYPGDGVRVPGGSLPMISEAGDNSDFGGDNKMQQEIIFATFADNNEQLQHVRFMVESIREFAGCFREAPIWVYLAKDRFATPDPGLLEKLGDLGVQVKTGTIPEKALDFYYAGKVFAAAEAELAAAGKTAVLVWLDEDTIILREPKAFRLQGGVSFAYRPVMHNRSGSLYSEPPDEFWNRIYEKLEIGQDLLFPMVTPADRQEIRAYFNAGLLVVRPERGLLRRWAESFRTLYSDPVLSEMCAKDIEKRIFLHQTALVSAVKSLRRDEMVELSGQYNYPMFFRVMYGGLEDFDSIADVVTLRYDIYFRDPDPQWAEKLKGPAEKISWLTDRLGRN